MFPIPVAGNNIYSHSAGGNMRVAYKDSKNLEYVKQFFDFLTREDNLKMFYEGRPDLQSNPSFTDVPGKVSVMGCTLDYHRMELSFSGVTGQCCKYFLHLSTGWSIAAVTGGEYSVEGELATLKVSFAQTQAAVTVVFREQGQYGWD